MRMTEKSRWAVYRDAADWMCDTHCAFCDVRSANPYQTCVNLTNLV